MQRERHEDGEHICNTKDVGEREIDFAKLTSIPTTEVAIVHARKARGTMMLTRSNHTKELLIFIIGAIRVHLVLTGTPQNRGKGVWTRGECLVMLPPTCKQRP